ncbi:hypothetical protein SELMODRAFT_131286 [Selaginella moellendorffii]|uniref:Peptidase S59 domain-containing protein n=2 Tax=Selaginella moellendorffii TaxID=88036 RepID=D8T3V4_SELML|nr:hypothetical protein SELMODRAFT_131286 [Selaginella moellendorffii]
MPESSEPGPSNQVAEPEAEPFVPTPKVTGSDYYIQPSPEEIRERHLSTPGGYCHRVDNFVVGRKQHGEIRFIGRTDVRELDVCDAVQFDKNQVIVYMDESKKPGVGDGLNKPAEVTLFNIHWNDNLDGQEQQEQQQQQFEMMLRDESERQGSHFISYDAASGEWKFLVDHFSTFGLQCKTLAT